MSLHSAGARSYKDSQVRDQEEVHRIFGIQDRSNAAAIQRSARVTEGEATSELRSQSRLTTVAKTAKSAIAAFWY